MAETIPVAMRECLQAAITKFDGIGVTKDVKKDLFRVLKVAETQGWKWGTRSCYGGGSEVSIWDGHDDIALLFIPDYPVDARITAQFMAEYLRPDFEPTQLREYNEELDAELKNEEALFGYKLPRPWRDAWYVQPKRDWGIAG